MAENISKRVLNSENNLERQPPPEESQDDPLSIRVVSTYGSDIDIAKTVKKYEEDLKRTKSFSHLTIRTETPPPNEPN
jgi:hypothetical protein